MIQRILLLTTILKLVVSMNIVLSSTMGIPNDLASFQGGQIHVPSPLFLAAVTILEDAGYVKRLQRLPDYPIKGIQITDEGAVRARCLKSRLPYRLTVFKNNSIKWTKGFLRKHYRFIEATILAIVVGIGLLIIERLV